jgi:type I restriction enzyme R subunit
MESLKEENLVFIFDECHRSQFGDTHKNIRSFFQKSQLIGFTGTPISTVNAVSSQGLKKTTADLFDKPLHKYTITDAINDENVLRFSIEYYGKLKLNDNENTDVKVQAIDTKEYYEDDRRIEEIIDFIIAHHDHKTHSKKYNAIMCVSNIDTLIKYYDMFKKKKEAKQHKLKIATIFTYNPNEEAKDANGDIDENLDDDVDVTATNLNKHSRDKLEEYIQDYNQMFGPSYDTGSEEFYNYYQNLGERVIDKEVDILLVVNMFLTGFDSPITNTLYVDKNLAYQGLIQAFSRTNRLKDEMKSQGNIVCFRNLKENTDKAIALFSNKDLPETVLIAPYEDYLEKANKLCLEVLKIVPKPDIITNQLDPDRKIAFVQEFREFLREHNVLITFSNFTWDDLIFDEQLFNDYKNKYWELAEWVKAQRGSENETTKVSILEDIDFELELIHKDEINIYYILELLVKYKQTEDVEEKQKKEQKIQNNINSDPKLRSKKKLIEKFIEKHLVDVDENNVAEKYESFIDNERSKKFDEICTDENLDKDKTRELIEKYIYEDREPSGDAISDTIKVQPKLLERRKARVRILDKIKQFVEMFYRD